MHDIIEFRKVRKLYWSVRETTFVIHFLPYLATKSCHAYNGTAKNSSRSQKIKKQESWAVEIFQLYRNVNKEFFTEEEDRCKFIVAISLEVPNQITKNRRF